MKPIFCFFILLMSLTTLAQSNQITVPEFKVPGDLKTWEKRRADYSDSHKPSATDGPLIYLNANPDVQHVLNKVEKAGGKILVPKTQISPEYGFMAVFIDTEGNRIALHSMP